MGVLDRQRAVRGYGGNSVAESADGGVAARPSEILGSDRGGRETENGGQAGVSSPVGTRWFRHAGGVNPAWQRLFRAATCRWMNGRTSRCGAPKVPVCARSLIGSTVRRRPSHVSCAGTPRPGPTASTTRHRRRSGTPNVGPAPKDGQVGGQRRAASLRPGKRPESFAVLMATATGPRRRPVEGRNKPHRGRASWAHSWSPEQIARRLPPDLPDDESMRICHEAIYQVLYVETRGALNRELVSCLRRGRALRVRRARTRKSPWACTLVN